MKLIYIANARIPTEKAHGLQIMKMCQAFVREGIEVELIAAQRFNIQFKNIDPFAYYNIKHCFKLKKLFSFDLIDLPIIKLFGRLGLWIQTFSFSLSLFFYLLFKKTDIIYSRDPFSLFFLSFFKKNLIYEAHNFPGHFWPYKGFLKKLKGLIVITQKLKEFFVQKGIPSDKILLAPDGVDIEEFDIKETQEECRQKLNLPLDRKIVLYTGHLFKWKGVYTLLEASQYLGSDILIVFVGGMEYDISKFKVEGLKFKNILVIGHRPPKEIPYWLKAADVLVLPNSAQEKISQYWTSPMKMFEYMAAQRPIVASDLPSIREILNSTNALLVASDNLLALAEGIKKLLVDIDFAKLLIKQAFEEAKKYTWQKRATKILNFIK